MVHGGGHHHHQSSSSREGDESRDSLGGLNSWGHGGGHHHRHNQSSLSREEEEEEEGNESRDSLGGLNSWGHGGGHHHHHRNHNRQWGPSYQHTQQQVDFGPSYDPDCTLCCTFLCSFLCCCALCPLYAQHRQLNQQNDTTTSPTAAAAAAAAAVNNHYIGTTTPSTPTATPLHPPYPIPKSSTRIGCWFICSIILWIFLVIHANASGSEEKNFVLMANGETREIFIPELWSTKEFTILATSLTTNDNTMQDPNEEDTSTTLNVYVLDKPKHQRTCPPPLTGPRIHLDDDHPMHLDGYEYQYDYFHLNANSIITLSIHQMVGSTNVYWMRGYSNLKLLQQEDNVSIDDDFSNHAIRKDYIGQGQSLNDMSLRVPEADVYMIVYDNAYSWREGVLDVRYSVDMTTHDLSNYQPPTCSISSMADNSNNNNNNNNNYLADRCTWSLATRPDKNNFRSTCVIVQATKETHRRHPPGPERLSPPEPYKDTPPPPNTLPLQAGTHNKKPPPLSTPPQPPPPPPVPPTKDLTIMVTLQSKRQWKSICLVALTPLWLGLIWFVCCGIYKFAMQIAAHCASAKEDCISMDGSEYSVLLPPPTAPEYKEPTSTSCNDIPEAHAVLIEETEPMATNVSDIPTSVYDTIVPIPPPAKPFANG